MRGRSRRMGSASRVVRAAARRVACALAVVACAGCGGDGHGSGAATPTPTQVPEPTPTASDTGAPSSIRFSPPVVRLDNPTSPGGRGTAGTFTVDVAAYDARGRRIEASAAHPIEIALHGVPSGAISPERTTLTSGSTVTFTYDGSFFANPITLAAWALDPAATVARAGGAATTVGTTGAATTSLETTQLVHQNPIDCTYGDLSYEVPVSCATPGDPTTCATEAIDGGLKVKAAVGYDTPAAASLVEFAIDTGSLGVIVPASELGPDAIGPGAAGTSFYDSSGNTYAGNYYIAPVSVQLANGSVIASTPVKVLAITSAYCAPGYPKCEQNPPKPDLHYLGVGFDRSPTNPEDQLGRPVDNPFLHLAVPTGSGDVSPGYVLGGSAIQLGVTSTAGFGTVALAPSTTVPGDWTTMSGCYGFPDLPAPNQFCGTLLLDVGIVEMFLDLSPGDRPADAVAQDCPKGGTASCVPEGTTVQIVAGSPSSPAASYTFTVADQPQGPAPTYAQWIDSSNVFVNTGRRPLLAFDYLYDARCGNVGFRAK